METVRLATASLCATTAFFAVARFYWLGLVGKYRWFACCLILAIIQSSSALLAFRSSAHHRFWDISTALYLCVALAVTAELWQLALDRYPGIEVVQWKIAAVVIAAAIAISILFGADLLPALGGGAARALYGACRFEEWALALICGTVGIWISLRQAPVNRNLQCHAWLLTAKFSIGAVAMLVLLIFPLLARYAAAACSVATATCYLSWAVLLSGRGERNLKIRPFTKAQLIRMDYERDALQADFQRYSPFRKSPPHSVEQCHSDHD